MSSTFHTGRASSRARLFTRGDWALLVVGLTVSSVVLATLLATTVSEERERKALCQILAADTLRGDVSLDRYLASGCPARHVREMTQRG